MRHITKILTLFAVTLACEGCFKKEVQGTMLKIAVYSKNTTEEDPQHTSTELMAYAFYVEKGEKWKVETWEDALAMKITNVDNPSEVLTKPDVIATWNAEEEYQLCLDLKAKYTSLVVVDVENRMFAYRDYETPINLPETPIQLHLYAALKSGSANGWTTVNPFYEENKQGAVSNE